jgi:hypothetical protein
MHPRVFYPGLKLLIAFVAAGYPVHDVSRRCA